VAWYDISGMYLAKPRVLLGHFNTGNFNSQPISYNYDASGKAVAIATGIEIENYTWSVP
jgi:hypothetical protein